MFGLIKKIFMGLLTGIVSASSHAKCVLLSNQKCMIKHALINLHCNGTVKNLTIIHLQEVGILLMTCLIKYVFQIKQKI